MFAIRNINRQFYIMYNLYDTLCFVVRWNTRLKQQKIMGYAMCIIRLSYMMANLSSWAAASTTEREREQRNIYQPFHHIYSYMYVIFGNYESVLGSISFWQLPMLYCLKGISLELFYLKWRKTHEALNWIHAWVPIFFLRHTILFARVDVNWG